MRSLRTILIYVSLPLIGLALGWLMRSCHDEQDCTTMFYAKGSQLECHQ